MDLGGKGPEGTDGHSEGSGWMPPNWHSTEPHNPYSDIGPPDEEPTPFDSPPLDPGAGSEGEGSTFDPLDAVLPVYPPADEQPAQAPEVDVDRESARVVSEVTGVDEQAAMERLAWLLTKSGTTKLALNNLNTAQADLDELRSRGVTAGADYDVAVGVRNELLGRYLGVLRQALASDRSGLLKGIEQAAEVVRSPDTPEPVMDFIAKGLLMVGVAVLASVAAGALGAAVVKDVLWKEVVKSAIGAFLGTMAGLTAERVWDAKHPRQA